jgi:diguanylate cyclase (GGDEF)-like protein
MNDTIEEINQRLVYANRKIDFDLNNRSIWVSLSYPLFLWLVVLLSSSNLQQSKTLYLYLIGFTLISLLQWLHHYRSHFLYLISRKTWLTLFLILYFLQASLSAASLIMMIQPGELAMLKTHLLPIMIGLITVSIYCLSPRFWIAIAYACTVFIPWLLSLALNHNYQSLTLFSVYFIFVVVIARVYNREYIRSYKVEMQLEAEGLAIERRSQIDSLTQIYNRGYFNTNFSFQWNLGLRNNIQQSLLIMDIDHFKSVNDTHGHLVGDRCLMDVADIIKRVAKRKTDLVARFGGEEFVVLLTGSSLDEAEKFAELIRQKIESHNFLYDGLKLEITISIGVATLMPTHSTSSSQLINQADQALYHAKDSGRNRVCCYSESGLLD